MADRRGEKIGWTGGWLGGFIWVVILSAVFLFQGKWQLALVGFVLAGFAVFGIVYFSPWRHPSTPYWKLMMAPYVAFFASVAWGIWSYGGFKAVGIDWWALAWFLPILIPVGSLYKRTWSDFDGQQNGSAGAAEPRR